VSSPPASALPLRLEAGLVRRTTRRTKDFNTRHCPSTTSCPRTRVSTWLTTITAQVGDQVDGHVRGHDAEHGGGGSGISLSLSKFAGQIPCHPTAKALRISDRGLQIRRAFKFSACANAAGFEWLIQDAAGVAPASRKQLDPVLKPTCDNPNSSRGFGALNVLETLG